MKYLTIAALLISVLSGCAGLRITTDHDAGADFSALNSYYLHPYRQSSGGNVQVTEMELERVALSLQQALGRRYQTAESMAQADLVVSFFVVVEPRYSYSTHGDYRGIHPWGSRGHWDATFRERVHLQGALVVDFYNANSGKMIWRGTVDSGLKSGQSPQQRQEKIDAAIKALLAKVPN
ncbi:MAG: DUF4136 domain-containing protein [Pseudomonadota bacterium]|nr:DUF4136 domain-containing protein [Pseudomonadota bacterium]